MRAGMAVGLVVLTALVAQAAANARRAIPASARRCRFSACLTRSISPARPSAPDSAGSFADSFRNGLVTNLSNGKAALVFVAVVPRSVDVSPRASVIGQALTRVAITVAVAAWVHTSFVFFAARAARTLARRSANAARQPSSRSHFGRGLLDGHRDSVTLLR